MGHTTGLGMTRGSFVAPPQDMLSSSSSAAAGGGVASGSLGWFASADELNRRAVVWCLATGEIVQTLDPGHPGPVCQVWIVGF